MHLSVQLLLMRGAGSHNSSAAFLNYALEFSFRCMRVIATVSWHLPPGSTHTAESVQIQFYSFTEVQKVSKVNS